MDLSSARRVARAHSGRPIGIAQINRSPGTPVATWGFDDRSRPASRTTHAVKYGEASRDHAARAFPVGCRLPVLAHRDVRHVLPELLFINRRGGARSALRTISNTMLGVFRRRSETIH